MHRVDQIGTMQAVYLPTNCSMNYQFENAHVLVVGDVMLDRYLFGHITRISSEAPVPICKVDNFDERPGGAANVAANIRALGGTCSLLGVVGQDAEGQSLRQTLTQAGVACYLQPVKHLQTIVKLRVLSQHQQLIRLDYEQPYQDFSHERLLHQYRQLVSKADVVVLSDYGKGTLKNVQDFIHIAKQHKKPVFVDPTGSDYTKYQGASMVIPNQGEFIKVAGGFTDTDDADFYDKASQLIQQLNLQAMLVTRGDKGMSLVAYEHGKFEMAHVAATDKSIYDVTGASDTVIGTAAFARASGYDLSIAMRLANAAAGVVVTKLGTATVNLDELHRAMHQIDDLSQPILRGVVSETELKLAVQLAKQHGETVVMTNGCFDLLHAGHVAFMQAAKQLGDRLIVAVNTDASVKRYKGSDRPIMSQDERMKMLAGLQAVDWVVAFDDDTPERLLHLLKPCVLVKGGDYGITEVVGADIVLNQGGKVKVIPHAFTDIHTTDVIEQLEMVDKK